MRIPIWPGVRLSVWEKQNPDAVKVVTPFVTPYQPIRRVLSKRGWMLLLVRYDWRDRRNQLERLDTPGDDDRGVLRKRLELLSAELDDQRKARQTAVGAADRFRDALCEVLGYPDDNPGDDVLVAKVREHFGKSGPEPTAWRDRLVGYEAIRDQINAAAGSREGER